MTEVFEIDVSGEDILSKDYVICVASLNGEIIKGFKMPDEYIERIGLNHSLGHYRYENSHKGKANLKLRLYCAIIYFLIREIHPNKTLLILCRDFGGREADIKLSLHFLIEGKLGVRLEGIVFAQLEEDSWAHKYSYLMRKDYSNQMRTYIKISLKELEEFIRKK